MAKKKIGLIGGGQIGGNLALLAVQKALGDVVLYDIPPAEGLVKGKALDINQLSRWTATTAASPAPPTGRTSPGADVLIITAGVPRKPGMSREDLLDVNLKIMKDVAANMKTHCPERLRDQHRQPARRDGVRAAQDHRLQEAPGGGHGRRARHARASSSSSPRR